MFKTRKMSLILISIFILSGCAVAITGYQYEDGWLRIDEHLVSPGYLQLKDEMIINAPIKQFIDEKGLPNYIILIGKDMSIDYQVFQLAYINEGKVYRFGRGGYVGLKKEMLYSQMIRQNTNSFPLFMLEEFRTHDGQAISSSESFCSKRKTCTQITTCEEAMYLYSICNHIELDENKNGIPCEVICNGGWKRQVITVKPSTTTPTSSSTSTSGCVWVDPYYRKDGTSVKGYWRCPKK